MIYVWWLTVVITALMFAGLFSLAIDAYKARTGALITRSITKGTDDA